MRELADRLSAARREGGLVPREALSGITCLEDACAVQASQVAHGRIAGWKLGATVAAAQGIIGLSEPFIGPLPADEIHDSGVALDLHEGQPHFAETEITLELGQALPPRDGGYDRAELAAAITRAFVSLEIVCVRIEGGPKGLGPLLIADGAGHRATVMGPEVDLAALEGDFPVTVQVGETQIEGTPAGSGWDNILDALNFIVERQHMLARPLQAGDLLMTGTMTGMTPLTPGQEVVADFAGTEVRAATRAV